MDFDRSATCDDSDCSLQYCALSASAFVANRRRGCLRCNQRRWMSSSRARRAMATGTSTSSIGQSCQCELAEQHRKPSEQYVLFWRYPKSGCATRLSVEHAVRLRTCHLQRARQETGKKEMEHCLAAWGVMWVSRCTGPGAGRKQRQNTLGTASGARQAVRLTASGHQLRADGHCQLDHELPH